MYAKATTFAAILAVAHARFGQEQIPIQAIAQVQGGASGVAPTIAGAAISDLLAGSNACDKLRRGDQIIAELGTGADAVAAAIGMIAAEKNFNPFVQSIPNICSDPTLPTTEVLRGITPLIDPAVVGSDIANALSAATSGGAPLDATGKSVADLLVENGFSNFTAQDSAGATSPAAGAGAGAGGDTGAGAGAGAGDATATAPPAAPPAATATAIDCAAQVSEALSSATATATAAPDAGAGAGGDAGTPPDAGAGAGAEVPAGVDFGLCEPTMSFEGGRANRPDTEFTFLPIDPLCAQGQQEALNPNIITNRICDQLTNVCQANQAAKDLCRDAQAQIQALGTRNKGTADTWNTLLGFAGTVTNPSGGPAEPPARMRVVRSYQN